MIKRLHLKPKGSFFGKPLLIFLLTFSCHTLLAQEKVSGTVSDSNGVPLLGVNVIQEGTSNGAVTDFDGNFELSIEEQAVLVFSYLGFETKEISAAPGETLNVVLEEDSQSLEEVVLVGYGSQNRKTVTSNVASVSSEEIENVPVAGTDQLLQGRASGVMISNTSGDPGSGVLVRIRGTSSISGTSDPLYVVDGIPIQSGSMSQMDVGGAQASPIADINPADIESIDILKDASATAIYGSRAANGVVLITTKRGTRKDAKISIGAYGGMQNISEKPSLVNGEQFERLMNESAINNGNPAPYPNPENATNTQWNELVLNENAPIRNVDVSLRGGSDKIKYFISGNNFMQEGLIRNTKYNRNTGRVNLDFDATSNLKMGTSVLYSDSYRDIVQNNDNIAGAFAGSHFYPSNMPVFQEDGSYNRIPTIDHPLATVDEAKIDMETGRFLGTVYGEYSILPGLRLKSTFSVDYTNNMESEHHNTMTNVGSAVQGSIEIFNLKNSNWIQENVLSYQFGTERNSFNVLLGNSVQESKTRYIRSTGTGFPTDDFTQISAAAVLDASSYETSYGIASVFTRINYDYLEKYLLTLNLRSDGSSRFGSENRWGIFPAAGIGWVLSEERFMENANSVNNLKLLASYGITGNQSGIRNFNSLGLWQGASYGSIPGVRPFQLENPDLKWETTHQLDIGLDLSMFENRFNFTAGYYYKRTEDLLLAVPLPRTSGYESVVQNSGAVQNQGLEFSVAYDVFSPEREFQWGISGNIAGNRNKVLELVAPFNVYGRDLFRYEEGIPMYSFYMHEQTGVNPQTGEIEFADLNGDGEFSPSSDRKIVGNANPDFFGGLTNNLSYKGFDLMFMFQFSYGNDQLNWTRFFLEHGGTRSTNYSTSQLDRWQEPGDITEVPKMVAGNYASDLRPSRFVEDGSYVRLKNISLGYTLPTDVTSSLSLSSARFYISGQNVLTFTNYSGLDPEVTATADTNLTQGVEFFTTPSPKVWMAGFNLSF